MFSLFISAMALQQDNQDLHTQETQFREIFLNLSKGQEELRTLLMGNLVKESPEDNQDFLAQETSAEDERLKHLQAEVDAMRAQMLGQVTIIQDLAQRQDELGVLVNQLLRGNQLGQTSKVEGPVIIQPPLRQEDKRAPQMAPVTKFSINLTSFSQTGPGGNSPNSICR